MIAKDVGTSPAEYTSYARMEELHTLQQPRTGSPFEMHFLLISHVIELIFRMVHLEVDQARTQLHGDNWAEACRTLERAVRHQRVLVDCWESMNSLPVDEFLAFRQTLRTASGTQSFAYRTLEFSLGNKDPRMVRPDDVALYPALSAELEGPTLYDEVLRWLARQGYDVPDHVLGRDVAAQYEPDAAVERAWLQVYRDAASRPPAYQLAERLLEVAYQFSRWRATHLLVVERMLGGKSGTAGTDGVPWLRAINDHRFFSELWSMRTQL